MIIDIDSGSAISWGATGYEKIADNVTNILKTKISEIPYMRDMGISGWLIDRPIAEIRGQIISDTINAIQTYEPRANLLSVEIVEAEPGGDIIIKVVIEV